jgi:hypothetical protein
MGEAPEVSGKSVDTNLPPPGHNRQIAAADSRSRRLRQERAKRGP